MAKEGAFQGYIEVNGVDLSDHCREFDAVKGHTDIPQNAMGDSDEYGAAGLKQGPITASFIQDFAAANVHATINPLYENKTKFPIVWRNTSGAASATNPEHSGDFYVSSYRPVGGSHGGESLAAVTFNRAGNLSNTA